MPKRIMSFKVRAKELHKLAGRFSRGGFATTARWIEQLSKTLKLPRVTFGEATEDLKDIHQAFKNEFVGANETANYREKCFEAFESLILGMIDTRGHLESSKAFERVNPALKSGNQALRNIAEIYLALIASRDLNDKRRYYGLCFMYLILIEGLFDENIRILYILKKASEGIDIDYDEIKEKPLRFFEDKLDPIFFEGYNNHIRNSIAHARFRFDQKKKKMIFKDRPYENQKGFKMSLSLREFGTEYYEKIDSFCRLRTYYLLFLGLTDLTLKPKPFGRTR